MGISYTVVLGSLASEMASHHAQRQERTPSVASVLLGLTQKDGSWVTTEMPAENRDAIMNDRSATLVHHGLKQPKSDVVTALATSETSSFHAAMDHRLERLVRNTAIAHMTCAPAASALPSPLLPLHKVTWRAPAPAV